MANLLDEVEMSPGIEGWLLCAHFVYYAAERPNIGVRPILLRLAYLRRHVEGCTDVCGSEIVRLKNFGKAKVTELDRVVMVEKDWPALVMFL